MAKDYYDILNVSESADASEIKRSYRTLARQYHPDRNPDDSSAEERFKEVQEAYEILGDEERRKQYDRIRRNPNAGSFEDLFGGQGFGGGGRGGQYHRTSDGTYVHVENFSDVFGGGGSGEVHDLGGIFEQFFGQTGGRSAGSQRRGGSTSARGSRTDARGRRRPKQQDLDRKRAIRIDFERMLKGGAATFTLEGEKIRVPFPKGVQDGTKVRIRGKGQSTADGRRGDLYITFRVTDHPDFIRDGNDLHTDLDVSVFEAMLGGKTEVTSPYGKRIKLTVPAGSQPGDRLRLRGHGIKTDEDTGDLIVRLDVHIPDDLSDEQKELIEKARTL